LAEYRHGLLEHQQALRERDRQIDELRHRMAQAQQRVRKALEVLPPQTPDLFELSNSSQN
jgi:hypothetical protein